MSLVLICSLCNTVLELPFNNNLKIGINSGKLYFFFFISVHLLLWKPAGICRSTSVVASLNSAATLVSFECLIHFS